MKMYCTCYSGHASFIVRMIFYFSMDRGWADMCLLLDYRPAVGSCCGLGAENTSLVRHAGTYFQWFWQTY